MDQEHIIYLSQGLLEKGPFFFFFNLGHYIGACNWLKKKKSLKLVIILNYTEIYITCFLGHPSESKLISPFFPFLTPPHTINSPLMTISYLLLEDSIAEDTIGVEDVSFKNIKPGSHVRSGLARMSNSFYNKLSGDS